MSDGTQSFLGGTETVVGMPDELNQSVKTRVFDYIENHDYRGIPRQDDGKVNPYQYCYGLGYVLDGGQMFGGMVAGYPTQVFQHYAPHIVESLGNSWVSSNVANIYRIVAHYPNHANSLLAEYETRAVRRGIKILYSLPTKAEKDAVCNFSWFERNGFNYYAETEGENARFYVKRIGSVPDIGSSRSFRKQMEYTPANHPGD